MLLVSKSDGVLRSGSSDSSYVSAMESHWMGVLKAHPMLFELIEHVFCAVASLCKFDRRDSMNSSNEFDMLGSYSMPYNYAIGWIDAQVSLCDVTKIKFILKLNCR